MSRPPQNPPQPGMMLEKYRGEVPAWNSEEIDVPYQEFLEAADLKSSEMQQALAASSDKRFRELLRQMNLQKNRNKKISTLAKIMDISMTEFTDWLRQSSRTKALSIAAQRLPGITSDMADDAMTQKKCCGRCDGWGFVTVPPEDIPELPVDGGPIPGKIRPMGARWVRDCPNCDATGKLKEAGDAHARTSLLLMNGISSKSSGVTVAINNNYSGHGIEAAGSRLAAVSFDISAEVIEGGDPVSIDEEQDRILEGGPAEDSNL